MLIEKKVIDRIEIVGEHKHVQVREITQIIDSETGQIVAKKPPHRSVCMCGQETMALQLGVLAIAKAAWTPAIKAAYKVSQEKQLELAEERSKQPISETSSIPINSDA